MSNPVLSVLQDVASRLIFKVRWVSASRGADSSVSNLNAASSVRVAALSLAQLSLPRKVAPLFPAYFTECRFAAAQTGGAGGSVSLKLFLLSFFFWK